MRRAGRRRTAMAQNEAIDRREWWPAPETEEIGRNRATHDYTEKGANITE
ncbi:hypothetical protein L195_g060184, partial [Trifolium pratense]